LLVSSVSRYLFSTLIISFLSYLLLGTFKATVMTFPSLPVIFSALRTKNALPDSMWSITDPFLILLTINSTELDRFSTPFHYYISYTIKIWNLAVVLGRKFDSNPELSETNMFLVESCIG
jgi:hypothetical protein